MSFAGLYRSITPRLSIQGNWALICHFTSNISPTLSGARDTPILRFHALRNILHSLNTVPKIYDIGDLF